MGGSQEWDWVAWKTDYFNGQLTCVSIMKSDDDDDDDDDDNRDLKGRRRRQRERQKTTVYLAKHWFCTCVINYGTSFFCRPLQNNNVK